MINLELKNVLEKIFSCHIEDIKINENKIELTFPSYMIQSYGYKHILENVKKYECEKNQIKKRKYKKQEYEDFTEINGEIWKELDNYPNIKVSNLGRIMKKGKIAILNEDKYGYQKINITDKNHKGRRISVHRLVAQAFIPNPENKEEIDHINTIRNDNRVENLRWVTPLENLFGNKITLNRIKKKGNKFITGTIKRLLDDSKI